MLEQGAIARREVETAPFQLFRRRRHTIQLSKHLANVQATTRQTSIRCGTRQLASAKGKLENAEAQVNYADLRSPIDGVVTDRPLVSGRNRSGGLTGRDRHGHLVLLAKVHIAQSAAQKIKAGGSAELIIPGDGAARSDDLSDQPCPRSRIDDCRDLAEDSKPGGHFKVGTPVRVLLAGATLS